jgi:uncharacterized protein
MKEIEFCGHPLLLLPAGSVFDPAEKALFVADLHLGKSAVFRDSGLGVPDGPDAAMLQRLGKSLAQTNAQTLVVLGDLFHARTTAMEQTLALLREWQLQNAALRWLVVPGNHDHKIPWRDWLPAAEIMCEPASFGSWTLCHHPPKYSSRPVLAGHLHPGISFGPPRQRKVKAACFWQRNGILILPAFGEFTGLEIIERTSGDRVWISTGDRVLEVPPAR